MKRLFAPNLDRKGRLLRGVVGIGLLASACFGFAHSMWLGGLLTAVGLFGLFEAGRG